MLELSHTAQQVWSPDVFLQPSEVRSIPAEPGIYGWWVRRGSLDVPAAEYQQHDGFELLYVGISPRKPSASGNVSKGNLRKRLNQHVNGNASQSTLRRTLGVLLMEQLGLTLIVRKGRELWREEAELTDWMHENTLLTYAIDPAPWIAEDELLERATLALNIEGQRKKRLRQVHTGSQERCPRRSTLCLMTEDCQYRTATITQLSWTKLGA